MFRKSDGLSSSYNLCRKYFQRHHTQLSKLRFANIGSDTNDIPIPKIEPTFNNDKNELVNLQNIRSPSMSRIPLELFLGNREGKNTKADNNYVQISQLPSWYERLNAPSSYRIEKDINYSMLNGEVLPPYRSFNRCYSKELQIYTDKCISLPSSKMKELQMNFVDKDIPSFLQTQYIKINAAERKLTDLSLNTFIMFKRLKIPRYTPPYYLHQQFLIHLGDNNINKLVELYFDLPQPRPLQLKREEFERFMQLLLRLKVSGDHKSLLQKIIDVYEDIRQNGCGITLTPFEDTKYLSFLLIWMKNNNLSQEEKFAKIMKLRENNSGNQTKVLHFCPAMWNILLSHFPERTDEIMKMMANRMGITRLNSEMFLKNLKTYDQFCNTLELMRLKNFHLDAQLFNVIIEKYIEFGKSKEALELSIKVSEIYSDVSLSNWTFSTIKTERTELFRIDILNKAFFQLYNGNPNRKFELVQYKFKPSPFVLGKLAISLELDDRLKLLDVMKKQNIPLVNKHALELLVERDFKSLSSILSLTNSSIEFNKTLHEISKNLKYDTVYYSKFIHESTNIIFELKEIFKKSLQIYDKFSDVQSVDDIRAAVAEQIVKLNEEIKSTKY